MDSDIWKIIKFALHQDDQENSYSHECTQICREAREIFSRLEREGDKAEKLSVEFYNFQRKLHMLSKEKGESWRGTFEEKINAHLCGNVGEETYGTLLVNIEKLRKSILETLQTLEKKTLNFCTLFSPVPSGNFSESYHFAFQTIGILLGRVEIDRKEMAESLFLIKNAADHVFQEVELEKKVVIRPSF